MAKETAEKSALPDVVQFLRQKDFRTIKGLGQGGFGTTILLHDEQIDELFVCKKYTPQSESQRQEHFINFTREIKLLHKLYHPNVVRVFNYYLYPKNATGYILMEFINGLDIDDHVNKSPETVSELYEQSIRGFAYLERSGILHRDIRPGNLMVTSEGIVKIIDLGFGKQIETALDFRKSISLNWWCETPDEFGQSKYDFKTEVYFLGKLFEKLIQDNKLENFQHTKLLSGMIQKSPDKRIPSFLDIEKSIINKTFSTLEFSTSELKHYREFAEAIAGHVTKIERGTKYAEDVNRIETSLTNFHRRVMLEEIIPTPSQLVNIFLPGAYYYRNNTEIAVQVLLNFLNIFKSASDEKKRIIIANIQMKLDAIPRYSPDEAPDDIPF